MAGFSPAFNVSWDASQPAPVEPGKPKLDAFGVDEAFASFKPSFSTDVPKLEVIMPEKVEPCEDFTNTIAATIFAEFCEKKFGFTPDFSRK
jgi:hypothetical protein